MRFQPLSLYKNETLETDALGNPINTLEKFWQSDGRFSNWTAQEVALDNRNVTVNNRKIVTRASKSYLEQADKLKFEGRYYSVKEVKGSDYDRWRILIVDRYGSEDL